MSELPKLEPVPILITSYNRINFLKRTIENINKNTLYPYYLFVVDNNSTDGSREYLKSAKVNGPTRPINMPKMMSNFPMTVSPGRMPVDKPTVPKAEMVSNNKASEVNCADIKALSSLTSNRP